MKKKVFAVSFILFLLINSSLYSQSSSDIAMFAYNIISFFDWSSVAGNELVVNTFHDDVNFVEELKNFAASQPIQGKKVVLKPLNALDVADGQVIFVGNSGLDNLSVLSGKKILIIAVGEDVIAKGADIAIFSGPNGVQYKYNPSSIKAKGFVFESRLAEFGTAATQ